MFKKLNISLFLFLFCKGYFLVAQNQIKNTSVLPNAIVNQRISMIDSLRKTGLSKEQVDATYYKSMLEEGYSRGYIDTLRYKNDPSYIIPFVPDNTSYKTGDPPVVLVTGPEQNCPAAISVCQQTYTQTQGYTGYGYQEVYNTCLLSKEQFSVWYVFTVQVGGTFGFTVNTLKDYDFALYNLTTIGGCSYVPTSVPVRCNFSSTYGNTGLTPSSTSELPALSVPATGAPFMTGLQVTAGNTYALVLDNFSMDNNGYTITFNGTSSIFDNIPPTLASVVNNCNGTITVTFSEPVKCSSITNTVTRDFTISGGASITNVSTCTSGTLTNSVVISYTAPSSGAYTIGISGAASDGNTILDKCNNSMSTAQTITFNHLGPITFSPSSTTICAGNSVVMTANGAPGSGATFSWNPAGGTTNPSASVTPAISTIYDITVSYGGCTQNASYTVTVQSVPVLNITPLNPVLCSGTTVLTASANPCVGCTYNWTGSWTGTGASTPAVGAGTYNVTATSSGGCASVSASSTVSIVSSPPANSCNAYYITPTGAGTMDGSSIANAAPISGLQAILNSISCNGATIKMQVGVYSISDALTINSYTTIEGGYNSTFTTKTSDMSTTGATVIRRTNTTGDGGSGTEYSAIKVTASATGFRLQDLRIEMPGAAPLGSNPVHAASSQKSNKAINLGAGCTSFNIVRCYIDAGVGANQ